MSVNLSLLTVECEFYSISHQMWYLSFFFFKQKTAYEMRISDWSSDVCSSDLRSHRWPDIWGQIRSRCHCAPLLPAVCRPRPLLRDPRRSVRFCGQIGRASCRERVCQYV